MKSSSVFAVLVVLASPAASFLLTKSATPFLKSSLKSAVNLPSQYGRQNVRFELSMSARVPFIAGNWKMNPETVDQVGFLHIFMLLEFETEIFLDILRTMKALDLAKAVASSKSTSQAQV
jgi:hypothetical protein